MTVYYIKFINKQQYARAILLKLLLYISDQLIDEVKQDYLTLIAKFIIMIPLFFRRVLCRPSPQTPLLMLEEGFVSIW